MRSNILLIIASVATAAIAAPAFQLPAARGVTKESVGSGDGKTAYFRIALTKILPDTIARCCDGSIICYPNICIVRCPPATPFREPPVARDLESGSRVGKQLPLPTFQEIA